jgi:hypothetical protein
MRFRKILFLVLPVFVLCANYSTVEDFVDIETQDFHSVNHTFVTNTSILGDTEKSIFPTISKWMDTSDVVPLPTPTPTPIQIKDIYIVYDSARFGDGGTNLYDFFLYASSEPDLIIYTDGQMLVKQNNWFQETKLSTQEMCGLHKQVEQALIYDGPTYNSTPLPKYGFDNGEPCAYISMSSDPNIIHCRSVMAFPYLTNEARIPYVLMENFREEHEYIVYKSNKVVLWIERVQKPESHIDKRFPAGTLLWPETPDEMPSLGDLLGDREEGFILIQGELAADIQSAFGIEPILKIFEDEGESYVVIYRPLLPHGSVEQIANYEIDGYLSPIPLDKLPFTCH